MCGGLRQDLFDDSAYPHARIFVAGMLVGAAAFVGGIIWLLVATIMGIVRVYRDPAISYLRNARLDGEPFAARD